MVDSVRTMLGSVSRFDFAQVGRNLPKVDLPDLERFLTQVMEANGRRVMWREDGLEVLVSEAWTEEGYELMPWMDLLEKSGERSRVYVRGARVVFSNSIGLL